MKIKLTKKQEQKIKELREKIEKAAQTIYKIKEEYKYVGAEGTNIIMIDEVMEEEEGRIRLSPLAKYLITKFKIYLYEQEAAYEQGYWYESIFKIYGAQSVKEFIKALKEYAKDIERWKNAVLKKWG